MSVFGRIWHELTRIRGKEKPKAPSPAPAPQSTTARTTPTTGRTPMKPTATAAPPAQSVDVEKVLTEMAAKKGGGGNWQTSIVDLLKLLDIDSSLAARKELADELNVHAGADGSAEQNIALSKAVWRKIAENGGAVPASLRD